MQTSTAAILFSLLSACNGDAKHKEHEIVVDTQYDAPSPGSLVVVDINKDGSADLVYGTRSPTKELYENFDIYIAMNDRSGSYTTTKIATLHHVAQRSGVLAAGDIDGNGTIDIIVGIKRFNKDLQPEIAFDVYCLREEDGYTPVKIETTLVNARSSGTIGLGDIDTDGDLDLFVGTNPLLGNGTEFRVYKHINDGKGNFE